MLELIKKINYDDLTYHFKDRNIPEKSFNDFDNAICLFKMIRDGNNMTLIKANQNQNEFKSDLNEVKKEDMNQERKK